MDLLIPDNWLREYLKTKAPAKKIAEALSLHGPSVEKVEETKNGIVYYIEVTTNRVDSVGIYGIAREASAILPRMGIAATLLPLPDIKISFLKKVNYLTTEVDFDLCQRFSAVLIKNTKVASSPKWLEDRLRAVGLRPINNIVDISNYIMHEIGQPVHTFDYDKITGSKMVLRASKKGERIVTLDEKTHTLPGGDIVIEDGSGRIIDLAGIMGGLNSAVDNNTKNVLLFVQTYNPVNIRKTSMQLAHKTEASILFEKGLDPELVSDGIKRGIALFEKLTGGQAEKDVLDLYPNPPKNNQIRTSLDFIQNYLDISLTQKQVSQFLEPLGFSLSWDKENLKVSVPSWRNKDMSIAQDVVEEVARIYGYYKIPSKLMAGELPEKIANSPFEFEKKIKLALKNLEAIETYTSSLVSNNKTGPKSLKLKNPLGGDGEYLRDTLRPSLIEAAKANAYEKEPFHLFEMSHVYIPQKLQLPEERVVVAGIFANTKFQDAREIIETLLKNLYLDSFFKAEDTNPFTPSRCLQILINKKPIGVFGQIENTKYIYYEMFVEDLANSSSGVGKFKPIPQYPPQIEDITISLPPKTMIGRVIEFIKSQNLVSEANLKDIYENSYTFRIHYQHPTKTLIDNEVAKIRALIIKGLTQKFGGRI